MKYKVAKVIKETHDTVSVVFDGPKLEYLPGQFIMINYPNEDTFVKRAYSIASAPTQDHLQICVKETPNGFVSKELQHVAVGTEFDITGPHGRFVFDKTKHKNIVLLGAGSGVVPYFSMLQYIQDTKLETKTALLTSQKTVRDSIYQTQFEKLAKYNSNISFYSSITREESTNENIHNGRITKKYLVKNIKKFENKTFFLCGPSSFVASMKEILIESGVTKENIELEVYG